MLIGIDAGSLGIKDDRLKAGVYQMAVNLFTALGKIDTTNTYFLYSFYPIEKSLVKTFGANFKNIVVKPARGWTKIWLPLQLLKDKPDVFVGLNQSLPLKLPLETYKSIVVIHDTLFEQFPKMYPGSFRKLHKETKSSAQEADMIVVPSEATKKDVEKYYKPEKEKIQVIHEGVRKFDGSGKDSGQASAMFSSSARMTTKKSYFLFVGALKPQKNVPRLLEAFAKLPGKTELVIVGGDKWRDVAIDKVLKSLSKTVQSKIHFLGVVSDAELAKLYENAIAFVSPSLGEGFGLTYVEAMSFGVPVVASKVGSVPEVVGKAGILVDPTKTNEIVEAMKSMLDAKTRAVLSKKAITQSQKFSWEKFASQFLSLLQS